MIEYEQSDVILSYLVYVLNVTSHWQCQRLQYRSKPVSIETQGP